MPRRVFARCVQLMLLLVVSGSYTASAAEPRLQRDVDARRVKLLESIVLKPYRAAANPAAPWAADADKLIPIALWHIQPNALDWWSGTRELHDTAAARDIARRIVATRCDDPYALFAAAWMLSDPQAEPGQVVGKALDRAYLAVEAAHTHPLVRYLIAQRCRRDRRSGGRDPKLGVRLDQEWPAYAVDAIASGIFTADDRDLQALLICDWDNEHPEYVPPRDYLNAITSSPKVDDWFKALTRGRHEVSYAWVERGNRYVPDTPPAQIQAFGDRLDRAADALLKAWTLAPDDATAPGLMITVEMGRGHTDEAAQWLRRAMEIQIDQPDAWLQYMVASMPRWGGSADALLQVATTAEQTNRYDTRVPWYAIGALRTLHFDDAESLRGPAVYGLVQRVCAGYRANPPPGMPANLPDSVDAAFAAAAGEWKSAAAAFARGGATLSAEPFTWFATDITLARMKSAAMASRAGEEISSAVANADVGRTDEAMKQFEDAAGAVPANSDALRYIQFRMSRQQFMADFERGVPAALLDPKSPECWLATEGRFAIAADASLHLDQTSEPLRMAFRPPFSKNFILRGKIDLDSAKPAFLPSVHIFPGVNFHDQSIHYDVDFYPLTERIRLNTGAGESIERRAEFGKQIDFTIEVVRQRITVRINGQTLISEELVPRADDFGTVGFAVDNWNAKQPAAITIRALTLQKVDGDGKPIAADAASETQAAK